MDCYHLLEASGRGAAISRITIVRLTILKLEGLAEDAPPSNKSTFDDNQRLTY
jgi:hypothetical protein